MDLDALRRHLDDYHEFTYKGEEGTGAVLLHTLHRTAHRTADDGESDKIIQHEYSKQDRDDDDEHAV